MPNNPLATSDDVEAKLVRPLTATEANYVGSWIAEVSAKLRNRVPAIDKLIARFNADSTDPGGIDPTVVAGVLAESIKRYLINPQGLASESEGMGTYSHSTAYALRSEKTVRGVLDITDDDMETLFPVRRRLKAGTIKIRPALAPRPVGRYGPAFPSVDQALEAVETFSENPVRDLEALDAVYGPLYEQP